MSTTVNYKGNQLTTINNGTATLNTKNTWAEDNIGLSVVSPTTTIIDTSTDTLHFKGGTIKDISTSTAPINESSYVIVQYGDATIVDKSEQNCTLTTKGTYVENDIVVTSNEPVTSTFESRNIVNEDGSTTREFEFIADADRFFDPNYPSGDCICTLEKIDSNKNSIIENRDSITKLYFPNLVEIDSNVGGFIYYDLLESFIAPNLSIVNSGELFSGSKNLKYLYLPELNNIVNFTFNNINSLEYIHLPKLATVTTYAFQNDTNLKEAIFDSLSSIFSAGFYNCSSLEAVVIKSETLCSLGNTSAFTYTPIRGSGGYSGHIYVKQSLIESYKTATNWSTIYANYQDVFLPIEGSKYENILEEEQTVPLNLKNIDKLFDRNYPYGHIHSKLELIDSRVCRKRNGVTRLTLLNTKEIAEYTFYNDNNLMEINAPLLTKAGQYAFSYCDSLKILNLPQVKTLGNYAFSSSGLEVVHLPEYIGVQWNHHIFYNCPNLEILVLPKYDTYMHNTWAGSCPNLKVIDSYAGAPGSAAFQHCTSLKTLILRKKEVVKCVNINALSVDTPFAEGGTGGKVYVPQDLISQYKIATNWSTLVEYETLEFVPIEGSEYEHFYADGTPIE